MKKWAEVALGIVTGIGGFLEIGSVATTAQAGAEFGVQLAWVLLVGTIGLAFLMEMSGRLAAVSKRTYVDQLRERFGIRFFIAPMLAVFVVSLLVVASEIGGVCLALEMATGIGARWWAFGVAFIGWLLLWRGTFAIVEQGTALIGLVSLAFLVAVIKLHPSWRGIGAAMLPSAPSHDRARYWYLAVSIMGASISPYLAVFYSSGAIEDDWTPEYIGVNRVTSALGNVFGGGLAVMVLVCAAMVLAPRHIMADSFAHLSYTLGTPLGRVGTGLFIATICATCFGATMEIVLSMAYLLAQGFGWSWSANLKPVKDARFTVAWSVILVVAAAIIVAGADPLKLTNISMVATAASLPLTIIPLVVLMNDRSVMSRYTNGWIGNVALGVLTVISIVLFAVSIPLQMLGGG
ncbi:MAG: divalent metal cation transporter [Gemmatimonadota bacterium]|nr:divalent metal cation transporter [Gemmatimonadota bacterium]